MHLRPVTAVSNYDFIAIDNACLLTGHMVTAGEFVDVNTTSWARTRTRDLLDGFERLFFVLGAAFGIGLILVAGLFLVKRHFSDQTVTGFAHLAGENVAVVFGVNGSSISGQHLHRNSWSQSCTNPKSTRRSGKRRILLLVAGIS